MVSSEDFISFFVTFVLVSCSRVCLLDVSRLLGLTLRHFAPVCSCLRDSLTRWRLAIVQEAVRVFSFSVFSIGLRRPLDTGFGRSSRLASADRSTCAVASCEGQIDLRSKGKFHITIHHISGHAENAGNECVDGAASLALKGLVSEDNVPSLWLDRRILAQRLLNAHYCLSRIAEQFARLFPDFRQVHYSVALPFLNSATSFRFSVCLGYPLTFLVLSDQLRSCKCSGKTNASAWQELGEPAPPHLLALFLMLHLARRCRMQLSLHVPGSSSRDMKCAGLDWDSSSGEEILIIGACLHLGFRAVHPRRRLWTAACRRHRL